MFECTHYILNEQGQPIPEPDTEKWAKWYESSDRQVAESFYAEETIRVSTVFLSLLHINKDTGEMDALYETMVFANSDVLSRLIALSETDDRSIMAIFLEALSDKPCPEIQKRYIARDEAIKGHEAMCTFIETCLAKGLLT